ncbi:hypothetical protein ACO2Q8_24010 [Larkinella sp. VNQ87]|uniref:hypothetical protein n=1 Tax=Larkinella sp. VNQ87 TaxID=3400921 RepID=UPI003C0B6001
MKSILRYSGVLSALLRYHLPGLQIAFQLSVSIAGLVVAFLLSDDVMLSSLCKALSIICSLSLLRGLTSS